MFCKMSGEGRKMYFEERMFNPTYVNKVYVVLLREWMNRINKRHFMHVCLR